MKVQELILVQINPTSLFTQGVHPLPDIRSESVGNWTTPVLPITKQPSIWKKEVSSFSNSAWKSQQGAYAHHGRTHAVLSQLGREWPNCRARFRSSSQSSMRQKLTEMRFHQLVMGLAGLFSSIEKVNVASITDTTVWYEGIQVTCIRRTLFTATFQALSSQEELLRTLKTNFHVQTVDRDLSSYRAQRVTVLPL